MVQVLEPLRDQELMQHMRIKLNKTWKNWRKWAVDDQDPILGHRRSLWPISVGPIHEARAETGFEGLRLIEKRLTEEAIRGWGGIRGPHHIDGMTKCKKKNEPPQLFQRFFFFSFRRVRSRNRSRTPSHLRNSRIRRRQSSTSSSTSTSSRSSSYRR